MIVLDFKMAELCPFLLAIFVARNISGFAYPIIVMGLDSSVCFMVTSIHFASDILCTSFHYTYNKETLALFMSPFVFKCKGINCVLNKCNNIYLRILGEACSI